MKNCFHKIKAGDCLVYDRVSSGGRKTLVIRTIADMIYTFVGDMKLYYSNGGSDYVSDVIALSQGGRIVNMKIVKSS